MALLLYIAEILDSELLRSYGLESFK